MTDTRTAQTEDGREIRQVERDIERTRGAIDRTLDEIGDRLHPQHLLHQAMDMFRSDDEHPNEWAIEVRRSGKRLARRIKRNPIPAVLIGAGAAWLWMQEDEDPRRRKLHQQWDDLPEHSGSWVDARTGEPYDQEQEYGAGAKVAPAWHADYDWSDAHDDEQSWTPRAESMLQELREAVGDKTRSVKERLGLVAGKALSLSGLKRSEIRRALHAQWDGIPSHSGSFVDARTGEPYDDSYGEHWQQLAALDSMSAGEIADDSEDESWKERAEQALETIKEKLGDTTVSAKERLNAVGSQLSTLAHSSQGFAAKYGQASRRKIRSMARGTKRSVKQLGHQVSDGYETTREYVVETVEENPLATGVAVLGLGLLVGAMLPSTRVEDRAIGEEADKLKARGAAAGREAIHRGQEAASAAGEAALDEARRQGLTPSQLTEQARHGVEQLADTAKHQVPSAGDVRSRVESVAKRTKDAAEEELHDQQAGAKPTPPLG